MLQESKIKDDDGADEDLQDHQKFSLRDQVRLAGFVDQFRDFQHGGMYRQLAKLFIGQQPEHKAQGRNSQPGHEQATPADSAEKGGLIQIRKNEIGFAAVVLLR